MFVDDDGYICFYSHADMGEIEEDRVFWTLHSTGWEAFLPNSDSPCFYTWKNTYPSDDELGEVAEIFEFYLKEQNKNV